MTIPPLLSRNIISSAVGLLFLTLPVTAQAELHTLIRQSQAKVVKIYGAGGFRKMEAYQTGIIVSPTGHVLTSLSYVLDTDDLTVVLDDGRRFTAEFVGNDLLRELALLKLPGEEPVPYFDLRDHATADVGDRVLALSNLYGIATGDEPVSVLQGIITAIAPLDARRGAVASINRERVYIVDAYTNNPGAAGGALVDWHGKLIGLLGEELKSRVTGTWLNYAIPVAELDQSVVEMLAGGSNDTELTLEPLQDAPTLEQLGIRLVPDVLPLTPPYVDFVRQGSPADAAGMRADDLIVFVVGKQVASCHDVGQVLSRLEPGEEVRFDVLREGDITEITLTATPRAERP